MSDAFALPAVEDSAGVDPTVADAVRTGLSDRPKWLPPWLLYDAAGSDLFERITRLPEYYLTRVETALLEEHAPAMLEAAGAVTSVIELGAGSATKTRILLRALLARQQSVTYLPVDVSPGALRAASDQLRRGLPGLEISPVRACYPAELGFLRRARPRRLVLLLGSNIGNYEPDEAISLLRQVRQRLETGDEIIVGADLRKDPALLLPAYDDAAGVTASFNQNLLGRINRELGGRFDPSTFHHVVRWNDARSRVELFLESQIDQIVPIQALDTTLEFVAGERIHTENSYKLDPTVTAGMLKAAGFRSREVFFDPQRWFAAHLGRVR